MKQQFIFLIAITFFSCGKDKAPTPSPTPSAGSLYFGGYDYAGIGGFARAVYWKDGTLNILSDGTKDEDVLDMFISGNDLYACGEANTTPNNWQAKYWKNGTATMLSANAQNSTANALFIKNGDVYIGGNQQLSGGTKKAIIWKNGVATDVTPTTGTYGTVKSIFVDDANNVYASGFANYGNGTPHKATIWTNGVPAAIAGTDFSEANRLFVSGSDVYVTGFAQSTVTGNKKAMLWKNGTPISLTDGATNAFANDVFVSSSNVYVVGQIYNANQSKDTAALWVNGVLTKLTDGTKGVSVYRVKVAGTDVYVCGEEAISAASATYTAKYWKNGTAYAVSTSAVTDSYALTMFIK